MILPYPLDVLPELVGRAKAHATGWTVQGQRVEVSFDPSDDSRVAGTYFGLVSSLVERIVTIGPKGASISEGPFVLVTLDQPILLEQRTVHSVLAMNRYVGHKPWRLAIASCMVNLYELHSLEDSHSVSLEAFIGSGVMRIKR